MPCFDISMRPLSIYRLKTRENCNPTATVFVSHVFCMLKNTAMKMNMCKKYRFLATRTMPASSFARNS